MRAALAQNPPSVTAVDQLTKFTERSRRVLTHAAEPAQAAGAAVTTSGLLTAIVAGDSNLASCFLRSCDIDLDKLVADLASTNGTDASAAGEPFSTAVKDVIRQAVSEAVAFGHNYVGADARSRDRRPPPTALPAPRCGRECTHQRTRARRAAREQRTEPRQALRTHTGRQVDSANVLQHGKRQTRESNASRMVLRFIILAVAVILLVLPTLS